MSAPAEQKLQHLLDESKLSVDPALRPQLTQTLGAGNVAFLSFSCRIDGKDHVARNAELFKRCIEVTKLAQDTVQQTTQLKAIVFKFHEQGDFQYMDFTFYDAGRGTFVGQ